MSGITKKGFEQKRVELFEVTLGAQNLFTALLNLLKKVVADEHEKIKHEANTPDLLNVKESLPKISALIKGLEELQPNDDVQEYIFQWILKERECANSTEADTCLRYLVTDSLRLAGIANGCDRYHDDENNIWLASFVRTGDEDSVVTDAAGFDWTNTEKRQLPIFVITVTRRFLEQQKISSDIFSASDLFSALLADLESAEKTIRHRQTIAYANNSASSDVLAKLSHLRESLKGLAPYEPIQNYLFEWLERECASDSKEDRELRGWVRDPLKRAGVEIRNSPFDQTVRFASIIREGVDVNKVVRDATNVFDWTNVKECMLLSSRPCNQPQ